jgi:GT2 family glycosyltransferase
MPADLAIVIVSTNEAHWLEPCLRTVFAQAGDAELDVVVVDNESTDGTRELVESNFPARVVGSVNRGFSYANNRGALTTEARYVLFLNPDTEIVAGTFGEMVALMDARPHVGLAGARQLDGDSELYPTIRRFPGPLRSLGDSLGSERWPVRPSWAGGRVLDPAAYDTELPCDWTSGSFMFARREALLSAGLLDERFFIYSEEVDLCLRIKRAGWEIVHLPQMTIIHHAGKGGVRPKMAAQDAWSRRQYAEKHFPPARRRAYLGAVLAGHVIRAAIPGGREEGARRRAAARLSISTVLGRTPPPFGQAPATALEAGAATPAG